MRKAGRVAALVALCALGAPAPARAVNTWAGNTAEDMAVEQRACAGDAARFCGGNTLLIFEMENCLKRYLPRLSKACRRQLSPTDFRKYHRKEGGPFDFLDW